MILSFADKPLPSLSAVGGKGLSLARMTQAGLSVPPGFMVTTVFFEPWHATLREFPEWSRFLEVARGDAETLRTACDALKARAGQLRLSAAQRAALDAALATLPAGALLAVRSSSPEEDLEGASFAGGYETILGATRESIESAVSKAFCSCLDARVAIYKRENGFDPAAPRIAVVVQQQIASEVAGVGLSLNPITNDYDEAVFNANWGLGESVVSGRASPDSYVVDKVSRRTVSRHLGKKETSLWLTDGGGTRERPDPRHEEWSLQEAQLASLTDQLVRIEALYGKPMDIEWAFAGGALYLLQARPMTAYLALPDDLVTQPGAPRRLYFDVTLSVQGFLKPMSVMGTSNLATTFAWGSRYFGGRDITGDLDATVVFARHGRIYANLSRLLAIVGKPRILAAMNAIDPPASQALAACNEEGYRRGRRPSLRTLLRVPPMIFRVVRALSWPTRYRARVERMIADHLATLPRIAGEPSTVPELAIRLMSMTFRLAFLNLIPALAAWRIAMARLRSLFPNPSEEEQRLIGRLDQSLPGNVTVEMGLELARLARQSPPEDAGGYLPPAWKAFLDRYGHRGPGELDIREPRYRDNPGLLLAQARQVAMAKEGPDAMYERSRQERLDAVERLAAKLRGRSGRTERRFRKLCRAVEMLGGFRETPKFLIIKAIDIMRTRVIWEAIALAKAGRLDRAEDVFDLRYDDLAAGLRDRSLDLRLVRAERRGPIDRLSKARELPRLVDSRGRILRPPPRPLRPGELSGQPVSVGIARGKAKILHSADEKPLLPGEVLVARATDPGWTPLFVNAAAVVLEVGGALQHGALVAREYGKPCVSGVEDATSRLRDGEWIEVDGNTGIVRTVEDPAVASSS